MFLILIVIIKLLKVVVITKLEVVAVGLDQVVNTKLIVAIVAKIFLVPVKIKKSRLLTKCCSKLKLSKIEI